MAKKKKSVSSVVSISYAPVLSGASDVDSNNLFWSFETPPAGNIIKWSMLNRKYTAPNGQVSTYLASEWIIIKSIYQESWYNAGQPYVTSYEETTLVPFDTTDLPTGTYEYQLRGSYGQIGTSLYDKPFISNIVTLTV